MMTACLSACAVDSATAGYDRIGAVGTDVLFAKVDHASDGDYVQVLLRDRSGRNLCDARGPLMTDRQMPALCNDDSPDAFVYVGQVAKHGPTPSLCREDGGPAPVVRLKTADSWAADFVVEVDRPGNQSTFISFCKPSAA